MLLASFYLALNGALAKVMAEQMSSVEIVFFRNVIGLLIVLYAFRKSKNFGVGGKPLLLIFRGVIGSCGILATFYNIAVIDLGTAFSFQKTAPIFTAVFSAIFLGEKLNFKCWFAVFFGFIGILFITKPHIGLTSNDIIGVLGGMCAGLAYTSVRELRKYYSTNLIIFVFVFCATIVTLTLMLLGHFSNISILNKIARFTTPNFFGVILILLLGICGLYFQIYMTKAFAASKKAGIVAAVSYSDVLFSFLLGLALGDTLPDLFVFIGVAIIVISGVFIAKER